MEWVSFGLEIAIRQKIDTTAIRRKISNHCNRFGPDKIVLRLVEEHIFWYNYKHFLLARRLICIKVSGEFSVTARLRIWLYAFNLELDQWKAKEDLDGVESWITGEELCNLFSFPFRCGCQAFASIGVRKRASKDFWEMCFAGEQTGLLPLGQDTTSSIKWLLSLRLYWATVCMYRCNEIFEFYLRKSLFNRLLLQMTDDSNPVFKLFALIFSN